MSAAQRYIPRYTVAEYQNWEGDWELWAGVPVAMSPSPFGVHQTLLTRLAAMLSRDLERIECDAEVIVELDWIISDDTVVRPDLVVVCGAAPTGHLRSVPALAAEILSDSSQLRDQVFKRDLYEEQGVDVYLLLDPSAASMQVFRRRETGGWQAEFVDFEAEIRLCGGCVLSLNKAKLFRQLEQKG